MSEVFEVEILAGPVKIGAASIKARDYGMGVAGGTFLATEAYVTSEHAALVEGERPSRQPVLQAKAPNGEAISCEVVAIIDYSATVGEDGREVELYGLDLVRYFGPEPTI